MEKQLSTKNERNCKRGLLNMGIRRKKKIQNEKCAQAILFARVSSKKQKDKGVSLDVQMEAITKYCHDKGLKILKDFSIDESSTKGERKQYHEMLDYAKNCEGKVAIVVNYVDRLQRNYDDTYELNRLRKDGKIEVHFLRENLIIHKDSNSIEINFWNMHVLMANAQVNNMIDKVKASQALNWSLGKWQGFAPIGYLNAKDENYRSTLIVDEVRAPIIQKLFEEFVTGTHSIETIWELAKKMGLYTKMKSRRGQLVSKNTVYDILTNPFYYGEMCVNGNFMPHIYPPLISKVLFDRVQDIFTEKGNHNRANVENDTKHSYAFRKLIHCKECGGWITPATAIKKNGAKYKHLRCSNNRHGCHQSAVMEHVIMDQLEREVFQKISLPTNLQEALKNQIVKDLNDTAKLNTTIKTNITKKINELKVKEDKLLDFYLEGKLTQAIYDAKKAIIDREMQGLQETIEKYKSIDSDTKNKVINLFTMAGNISNVFKNASPTRQNELLKMLLDDCKLNGNRLEYTLRKPFDKLIACKNSEDWSKVAISHLDEVEKVKV